MRTTRWIGAAAAALFTAWLAKQVWGFFTLAALNRHDLYLEGLAWFAAAVVAAFGLAAIGSLFATPAKERDS